MPAKSGFWKSTLQIVLASAICATGTFIFGAGKWEERIEQQGSKIKLQDSAISGVAAEISRVNNSGTAGSLQMIRALQKESETAQARLTALEAATADQARQTAAMRESLVEIKTDLKWLVQRWAEKERRGHE